MLLLDEPGRSEESAALRELRHSAVESRERLCQLRGVFQAPVERPNTE
jgi:hypothetical protein